ncbi:MAG: winged helix-turn-helix transcriptional regulator [Oscillospiraceae bacterium]|nr:winged helix-turn-helix transcriptional regulator [Oscillospiraceae bacterium]
MPPETELAEMAELFKVFGDSTRIRILYILSQTELCVCDIASVLGMTQPAVSYQLKVLKQARLVRSRREGKTVYYALDDGHVGTIIGMAKEHLEEE